MEYTCLEGMTLPFLLGDKRSSSTMNGNSMSPSSASTHLLESFHHAQQQQHQQQQHLLMNQSYNFYNPQLYNFPAVSWSTTDPTLLLTDHQQRPEFLFTSGDGSLKVSSSDTSSKDDDHDNMDIEAASFPTVQQLFHGRSGSGGSDHLLHHNHGEVINNNLTIASMAAEQSINLHDHGSDMTTLCHGRSNRRENALSSNSCSASNIDPFSFCVGTGHGVGNGGGGGHGGGNGVSNASSQAQWMQQICSLSSDQYYTCSVDSLMMPKLVSDPFIDSPQQQHQHQQQQQQQPCSYYTSSTSVNCLHEADSCGSSDRDRSTTSEEINRMSNNNNNNSDLVIGPLSNLRGPACLNGIDSVTGLMLQVTSSSSLPVVELPDELSSSIAAAAGGDDTMELTATTPTTALDHMQQQHHHRRGIEGGAAAGAAPSGRVSWMAPSIGSVRKNNNNHVGSTTTLDPLLLLGSAAAAAASSPTQFCNDHLLPSPRLGLGPFKVQAHRGYTLDQGLPTRPFSFSSTSLQDCSNNSMISPRYNSSVYSMPRLDNPALQVDNNCTTSGSSFYKDFHSFSASRPQHHGVAATTSSAARGGGLGVKEFSHLGGAAFESRKDYCSDNMTLLSAGRKPNATSIEPQSVAARHRRKKISERVRILEKLIPGGNKMDTASMLDEAIDYVKFLQLQVQLLESMGEPESPTIMHPSRICSTAAAATTSTTGTSMTNSAFHPHSNNCKVDHTGSALMGGGFGSSHHLSRSSALMQQVTIAAANAANNGNKSSSSTPPLILSEVLQEQLFKQKLCLVSLRQYCPQGRRSSVGSIDWSEANNDGRSNDVIYHKG
ncbi:unnamed protein product [Calypogeia fissa]